MNKVQPNNGSQLIWVGLNGDNIQLIISRLKRIRIKLIKSVHTVYPEKWKY